ncbi:MAG: peptidoglycan-binding protein [Acidimicrobiia bacterium]
MSDAAQPSQGDTSGDLPHPLLAPKPLRPRRIGLWVTLGVLAVGALVAWQVISRRAPASETVTTQALSTATIKTQDLSETTTLSGTLEFEDPVNTGSPSAGYVVTVASEGSVLQRGDVIAMVSEDVANDQVLQAQQRVVSAKSSLSSAQEQYTNTVAPPSDADLATAQVAVTKATDAYNALFDPPSDADLAAARAQVDKTTDAYKALFAGPTDQQLADAQLAVDRANASYEQAQTAKALALLDVQSAQTAYCSMATVPLNACTANDIPLSTSERSALLTAVDHFRSSGDDASAATTEAFLNADLAYRNAVVSSTSAVNTQNSATQALVDLQSGASDADVKQALANLYSAQDHLNALTAGPTDAQVAAAEADKLAAEERLANLQAGASSASKGSASSSVQSAKLNLQLAQQDLASLVSGPKVVVLFYGPLHMWRTLSEGVTPGSDVTQLETNLLALGFDDDGAMVVDDTFDEATTAAVEAWQESLGLEQTGVVDLGTIMYVDGPSQVTSATVTVGDGVNQSTPVAELTPIERVVDTVTTGDGGASVTETEQTTQRVTSQIDVSDRGILEVGMPVTVVLPDDSEIDATVESIGDVATTQTGQGGSTSVIDVVFTPSTSVDAVWTGASVDIDVVTSLTKDALTVPVTALLATLEGDYAVQVVNDDGSTTLVQVATGQFNNGYVQITGEGLADGMKVVVP